ncbi:polyprenyl synthetase family protein [Lutispora thermophila]|uniref:Farnesyl diphosphate synthase n=1 Tax=Lutispora thermophila DSM 19022 TaxID=1122184 RepID=A0A1M6F5I8_9FIRM|nr:farnesyl diphosphate synthase [Lutispora thermophila]SHI92994.1 geranylgeranyl diphosphate synthase, type II [Lutispora thermophila DSM 19022]
MSLKHFFEQYSQTIEEKLNQLFSNQHGLPIIEEAMKYSILNGGKRLRPLLTIMACDLFNGSIDEVMPYACCIEIIHTYSLIHDDLPAMDNDDYRRGKLSNHKVYGEGFALLAGDALLNSAYEILIDCISHNPSLPRIRAASIISKAAGIQGMIGGQAIDLYYENKKIDIAKLNEMHSKKTGSLIRASLEVGAVIAKASEEDIDRIRKFGESLGRAYQISDDILDVIGTKEKMGKTIGKDEKSNKSTYISYYGLNKSKEILLNTINDAKGTIDVYGNKASTLKELADFIAHRDS